MASESFSQLSEPFQPVEGLTLYPNQWLNIDSLRFEDLLFGYFLGILDLRAVIDIESERSKRGQILDARELHLISIAEDPEAVGTYLRDTQPEEIVEDRQARRLWLRVLLLLMVQKWDAGTGDPLPDSVEALDAWGEDGRSALEAILPRGVDSLLFGAGARRRLITRTRAYIASTLSETASR